MTSRSRQAQRAVRGRKRNFTAYSTPSREARNTVPWPPVPRRASSV
ncbi:MAG TPA: hypothetical protein VFZ09_13275 [Archangium sp.]|nr:hypothetical protein [Archangium sp.]HEX5747208.1 hypothetical protein [Archangium sp.]